MKMQTIDNMTNTWNEVEQMLSLNKVDEVILLDIDEGEEEFSTKILLMITQDRNILNVFTIDRGPFTKNEEEIIKNLIVYSKEYNLPIYCDNFDRAKLTL
jgi:exosome complex RNA-binding protein Rrp42 (RNase PH superfamily)